ncbi:MAG: hypothetical protein AAF998_07105 [Bacteroidota bacterium]
MKSILLRNAARALGMAVLFIALAPASSAQIKSQGPFCGKVYRSNPSNQGALYWVNASGARCDEDANRALTDPVASGQFTQYLQISDFGFDIPVDAVIDGVEVVVIRRSDHAGSLSDRSVKLMRYNVAIGANKASSETWDTEWTAAYYGDKQASWGTAWTAQELNRDDFGVVLDVGFAGDEGQPQVDEVLVTVYYSKRRVQLMPGKSKFSSRFTCNRIGSLP